MNHGSIVEGIGGIELFEEMVAEASEAALAAMVQEVRPELLGVALTTASPSALMRIAAHLPEEWAYDAIATGSHALGPQYAHVGRAVVVGNLIMQEVKH
jgi:hypothetical protein